MIDAEALDISDLEEEPGADLPSIETKGHRRGAGTNIAPAAPQPRRASLVARQRGLSHSPAELPCCLTCYRLLELHRMRYYALVFHTENTVKELKKLKVQKIDEWDDKSIKYLLHLYKSAKKDINVTDVLSSQRKRKLIQMLRVRAGTAASVTKTSTFSIPHHAAPGAESRASSALQKKRKEASPEKRSRTPETREHKLVVAAASASAKKDQTEENIDEDKQSPEKDRNAKDKVEITKPYMRKLNFKTIGHSGTDES